MTGPKHKDYPWRRNRRRLIWGMVVFFCAAVSGLAAMGWRAERGFQQQTAAIRAKGEPITPSELAQRFPAPAKKDNAAESYGKAGESLKPVLGTNSYSAKITAINEAPPQRFSDELRKWMEAYLAEHAETLRVLHKAAKNPAIRYDFDLSKGSRAPLPDFLQLYGSAQLLQLEAYTAVEEGDSARAVEAIVAELAMDRSVREAPLLIMHIVRHALLYRACTTIKRILPTAAFTDEQLVQLQHALAETNTPQALTNVFIGERACGLSAYDQASGIVHMVMAASGDRERYLTCMTEMVDASRLPYPEAMSAIRDAQRKLSSSFLPSFAQMITPDVSWQISETARSDAFMAGAQAALALERYRLANGRVPRQIADLVPAFVSAVPLDPFDHQSLRYLFDDHGYTFYGVGENLTDDGGNDTTGKSADVVFRVVYP